MALPLPIGHKVTGRGTYYQEAHMYKQQISEVLHEAWSTRQGYYDQYPTIQTTTIPSNDPPLRNAAAAFTRSAAA